MRTSKSPHDASLLDILIDGFEKNEVFDGFHQRTLPMPDVASALSKFAALIGEIGRWQGEPLSIHDDGAHRSVTWPDVELIQVERGIMLRVRAPRFARWWQASETWKDGPLDALFDWITERPARA